MSVYVLYGVADRDSTELVGMIFQKKRHAQEFAMSLPGNYDLLKVKGARYRHLEVRMEERWEA